MEKVRLEVVEYEWTCPECGRVQGETEPVVNAKCAECDLPVEFLPA